MKHDYAAITLEAERLRNEFIRQGIESAFAALARLFSRKRAVGKAV